MSLNLAAHIKIESAGKDLTRIYAERLISLKVTHDAGEYSDSIEIILANPDGKIAPPLKGKILDVHLGQPGNLVSQGSFIIDGFRLEGPLDTIRVNGKAAPFITAGTVNPFHSRHSRSFDNITIGDLVAKIAREIGLMPAVDPNLAAITIPHVDQTAESSMNLLTRLARTYGGLMKPVQGHICFVQWGRGLNAKGQNVGGLTIARNQTSSYSMDVNQQGNLDRVRTRHHDVATGSTFLSETTKNGTTTTEMAPQDDTESSSDSGDDDSDTVYEHPHDYPDKATAEAASRSIYDKATMASQTISVTTLGNPKIIAGGMLNLTGFPYPMNQAWWISKVEHEYAKHGFLSVISGMLPRGSKGAAERTAEISSGGHAFRSEA